MIENREEHKETFGHLEILFGKQGLLANWWMTVDWSNQRFRILYVINYLVDRVFLYVFQVQEWFQE